MLELIKKDRIQACLKPESKLAETNTLTHYFTWTWPEPISVWNKPQTPSSTYWSDKHCWQNRTVAPTWTWQFFNGPGDSLHVGTGRSMHSRERNAVSERGPGQVNEVKSASSYSGWWEAGLCFCVQTPPTVRKHHRSFTATAVRKLRARSPHLQPHTALINTDVSLRYLIPAVRARTLCLTTFTCV